MRLRRQGGVRRAAGGPAGAEVPGPISTTSRRYSPRFAAGKQLAMRCRFALNPTRLSEPRQGTPQAAGRLHLGDLVPRLLIDDHVLLREALPSGNLRWPEWHVVKLQFFSRARLCVGGSNRIAVSAKRLLHAKFLLYRGQDLVQLFGERRRRQIGPVAKFDPYLELNRHLRFRLQLQQLRDHIPQVLDFRRLERGDANQLLLEASGAGLEASATGASAAASRDLEADGLGRVILAWPLHRAVNQFR